MKHQTLAIVVAAGLLIPATTNVLGQPTAPDNRVTVKEFLDIPGTAVGDLTGNVKFPNSPDLTFFPGYFEWPQSSPPDINVPPPADYKNNYGTQIQGYFFPPTTGAYIFRLCADDNAQLWLSTDSNPANKVLIATEPQWNNPRDYFGTERRPNAENVSTPVTLQANQPYYIEALAKEGGGGDNLSVAVEGGGITETLPIPGQYLAMYRQATGAPVIFSVQPESVLAVVGGQPVTMTVATDGPWAIQWVKTLNGVTTDIAGATSAIYTYTPVAADNGATIAARITNDAGSTTSRAIPLEVDPDSPAQLVRGFLRVEHYGDIGGTAVLPFYSDPRYATRDYDFLTYAFGADVPQTSPNLDNFARIVSGWVQPPTTGQWRFFIRSDDASELHVDADVTHPNMIDDPHNLLPIAEETGCCAAFQAPGDPRTTDPIQLNAANRYALVAIYKEGGGGDWMQIAWRQEGDTTAPAQLQPIAPGFVYTMASPAGQRAEITTQPMSQTAEAGKRVEFTVNATTRPTAGLFAVQWTRDGVEIPGATSPTYRTPVLTVADNGAVFATKVFTLTGELASQEATLTVLDDITPPVPQAGALVSRDGTTVDIGVGFDEPVDDATASVQANYSVSVGTIAGFTYYPSSRSALIKVTGLAPGARGVVTVRNVADTSGNAIPAAGAQAPFTVSPNLTWNVVGGAEGPGGIAGNYVVPLGDGAFDVFSNGVTQWATYDESTFVYEEITGDFDKRVRVEYQDNSSQWARAGIIVREVTNFGVDRDAQTNGGEAGRYQKVHVNPQGPTLTGPGTAGNNTWEGNRRIVVGGATDSAGGGGTPQYPNAWCRIQREGSTVTIYRSDDGVEWIQLGQTVFDPPLPALVYVGPDYSPEIGNITNEADRGTFLAKFRNYGDTVPPVSGIGLNFGADEEGGALSATDVAGVPAVAQAHWNSLDGQEGSVSDLLGDAEGIAKGTSATVEWTSNNTWASTGLGEENNAFEGVDRMLMTGYLDTGNATTSTVTIGGIPGDLTEAEFGYDVYVYALGGVPGRGGAYRVVNPANDEVLHDYIRAQSPTNPDTYLELPTTDPNAWGAGTYLVFRNLTASNIRLEATTVAPWGFSGTPRAPVNALQLVRATEVFVPPAPRPQFSSIVKNADGTLTVTWQGEGVLQAAPSAVGPWETVAGATSPFTLELTETMLFGRILAN